MAAIKNIQFQPVKIGELDRLITLQTATAAVSDYHGETLTWTNLASVWAKISWTAGHESAADIDRTTAISYVWFYIRYLEAAKSKKMRISYDSSYYDVETVKEIGRQAFLEIQTKLFQ